MSGSFSRVRVRPVRRKVRYPEPSPADIPNETVELLLQNVYAERQARFDAIDGMDAKAGILFGFTGVLIALVATLPHWWLRTLILLPCVVAAGFCVAALVVRRVATTKAQETRDLYMYESPAEVARILLDTLVGQEKSIDVVLSNKADLVQVALVALAIGVAVMAVLVLLVGGH